jgi:hypothetical protein
VIIAEHPSETLAPIDLGARMSSIDLWLQQRVSEPLMIALGVIRVASFLKTDFLLSYSPVNNIVYMRDPKMCASW